MLKMNRLYAIVLAIILLFGVAVAQAEGRLDFQVLSDDVSLLEVDPLNPTQNLILGAWIEKVTVSEGVTFDMYDYIPQTAQICEKALLIVLDSGVEAEEFIVTSGWKEIADANNVSLLMIENLEGWKNDEIGVKKIAAAYAASKLRHYYDIAWDLLDLIAYGDGATVAMEYVMSAPDSVAAVLLFGGEPVTAEYMASMQEKESAEPGTPVTEISCPIWIFADELSEGVQAEVEYWKKANNSADTAYSGEYVDYLYLPSSVYHGGIQLDNTNIAQTRLTIGKNVEGTGVEFLQAIYDDYLWLYARHRGVGAMDLRYYVNPEDYGMEFHTAQVDDITRSWYVYVPEIVKNTDKKVPLVVAMAGRGGSYNTFASLTSWPQVANERGFIVAFPMASYGRQLKNGVGNIPMWNRADDVAFLRYLVDDIKANYPIDAGRVYATGQSMGSGMSTRASLTLPDVFTATGSTCMALPGDALTSEYYNEEYDCPVFVIYGEKDTTVGSYKASESNSVKQMIDYYVERYGLTDIEEASSYRSGPYSHYLFYNEEGVPMFRYSVVDNKGHANLPSESYLLYDEFFSKFYRDENGVIHYEDSDDVLDIR